jgi:carbon storage regulator CsrA
VIAIIDILGDKVRLGISAPKEVRVDREEVRARIDRGEIRRARP